MVKSQLTTKPANIPNPEDHKVLITKANGAAAALLGNEGTLPRYSTSGDLEMVPHSIKLHSRLWNDQAPDQSLQRDMARLCKATALADRILQFSPRTGFIKDSLNLVTHFGAAVETLADFGPSKTIENLIRNSIPPVKSYREYLKTSDVLHCAFQQISEQTGLKVLPENLPEQIRSAAGEKNFDAVLRRVILIGDELSNMTKISVKKISSSFNQTQELTARLTAIVLGNRETNARSISLDEFRMPKLRN